MQENIQQDTWKQQVGEAAVRFIEDGMVIGIGSGSTSASMVRALARRINEGLRIVGAVPTSQETQRLASSLNIPLTDLDTHPELDLNIDGADEIDPQLNLIKGGGGALLREKIVVSASRRFIVIADETKLVPRLNAKAPLPVEVIPFAMTPVRRRLEALGATVQLRQRGNTVYLTDNGNIIFDCSFTGGIVNPADMHDRIHSIVGVVDTGLFLNMAAQAIIAGVDGVKILP